jgi:hypothetical protein
MQIEMLQKGKPHIRRDTVTSIGSENLYDSKVLDERPPLLNFSAAKRQITMLNKPPLSQNPLVTSASGLA